MIADWNLAAYDAFVAEEKNQHPFRTLRALTMVHIAQHDALAAIRPIYASHALAETVPDADPIAAAASAAYEVLVAELPGQQTALQAQLDRSLAAVPQTPAREKGIALGQRAAAAIRQQRQGDGSDVPAVVQMNREGAEPGLYRPIPPVDFVYAPGWRHLKPFALQNPQQFRAAPPPALDSAAYTADFEEVKRIGKKGGTARTADETFYGKFWYELSEVGWNRIGRVVAAERPMGVQATARLFALLNMALLDAYVAGWDTKLHYDLWRPATAIRAADSDNNQATQPDATWESQEPTPPIHDYISTHSALGSAAAEVLAHVFGNETKFTFASPTAEPAGATRTFRSFSQAADENAESRIKAGLHFRFSCQGGQALGGQVGTWVVSSALRPLTALASRR